MARKRTPVAAKIALPMAGAMIGASPAPEGPHHALDFDLIRARSLPDSW